MTITRINQVESGIEKLLYQFKDKTNINSILTTYLEQSQSTQDAYEEMLDERSVFTAVGVQLDMIGKLVGEERFGRNDDDYRVAIFIKISINSSDGTIPSIRQIIGTLTGLSDDQIRFVEHYPAGVYIYLETEDRNELLVETVRKLLPVSVNLGYIGYGTNDLAFTPYDTEYEEVTLDTNTDDFIVTSEADTLLVRRVTQAEFYQKAWLAESVTTELFDLVDDVGDTIVDDEGDTISMLSEVQLTGQVHGICTENL